MSRESDHLSAEQRERLVALLRDELDAAVSRAREAGTPSAEITAMLTDRLTHLRGRAAGPDPAPTDDGKPQEPRVDT